MHDAHCRLKQAIKQKSNGVMVSDEPEANVASGAPATAREDGAVRAGASEQVRAVSRRSSWIPARGGIQLLMWYKNKKQSILEWNNQIDTCILRRVDKSSTFLHIGEMIK